MAEAIEQGKAAAAKRTEYLRKIAEAGRILMVDSLEKTED